MADTKFKRGFRVALLTPFNYILNGRLATKIDAEAIISRPSYNENLGIIYRIYILNHKDECIGPNYIFPEKTLELICCNEAKGKILLRKFIAKYEIFDEDYDEEGIFF